VEVVSRLKKTFSYVAFFFHFETGCGSKACMKPSRCSL